MAGLNAVCELRGVILLHDDQAENYGGEGANDLSNDSSNKRDPGAANFLFLPFVFLSFGKCFHICFFSQIFHKSERCEFEDRLTLMKIHVSGCKASCHEKSQKFRLVVVS